MLTLILTCLCLLLVCAPCGLAQGGIPQALNFSRPQVFYPLENSGSAAEMLCRHQDGEFWLLHRSVEHDPDADQCYFRLENLSTKTTHRLHFDCDSLFRPYIVEFFVEDDRIIVLDVVKVLILENNGPGLWSTQQIIPLPATALHCVREQGILHFWMDLCSSFRLDNSCFYSFSLKLADQSFFDQRSYPAPQGATRMFGSPRNVIDRFNNTILSGDVSNYRLKIMSADATVLDSIIHQPAEWVHADSEVVIQPGVKLQRHFPAIDSLIRNTSSIRRVELLNSQHALILWDTPNKRGTLNRHADIWAKSDGKWSLLIEARNDQNTTGLTARQYSLKTKSLPNSYAYDDGFFIEIIPAPPGQDPNKQWSSIVEYQSASDKFYLDNPLQYVILVRELDYD